METPSLRRSLAVVFCDLAGTTQLTAQEGDLVVANLIRDFYENAGRLGSEHHCLQIKFIGDGFLAAFENAADVLPCAAAVQDLAETQPSMRGRHLRFRFSLHFGEVLCIETSYGKDIFGDEVNTAAHLNDLADPGQIVISQAALQRMPAEQQSLAGPGETVRVRGAGELQVHRIELVAG